MTRLRKRSLRGLDAVFVICAEFDEYGLELAVVGMGSGLWWE
jgi:hypothetical protein